jgi:hypothetical protein
MVKCNYSVGGVCLDREHDAQDAMQIHVRDHEQADTVWRMLLEQTVVDRAECWVAGARAWDWQRLPTLAADVPSAQRTTLLG